ncbi:MAG: hypothetical protein J5944_02345 [Lentisphaeria bacterium]|nr:hypothetical protein [Lentisphaeria bacterium]
MKKAKSILTAAFLACVIGVFAQQTKKTDGPVFKAETTITVDKTTFKPGEKIPLKIVCTYPEDTHQVGSWRLVAYLTDIPGGFEKMPGFEIKPHKDPRWSYVETKQGYWFKLAQRKNKEFEVGIDTTNWPEGDYRMSTNITFQSIIPEEDFIYRAGMFTFTIEK